MSTTLRGGLSEPPARARGPAPRGGLGAASGAVVPATRAIRSITAVAPGTARDGPGGMASLPGPGARPGGCGPGRVGPTGTTPDWLGLDAGQPAALVDG